MGFYTQKHNIINGRSVWHYLIATPIGNIHVIEYEQLNMELKRFIYDEHIEKAERKFNSICKAILNGTL